MTISLPLPVSSLKNKNKNKNKHATSLEEKQFPTIWTGEGDTGETKGSGWDSWNISGLNLAFAIFTHSSSVVMNVLHVALSREEASFMFWKITHWVEQTHTQLYGIMHHILIKWLNIISNRHLTSLHANLLKIYYLRKLKQYMNKKCLFKQTMYEIRV